MSSWFGSGLSQITGQITNFTKEVLEEGTEEIDDTATQLKITRNRLIELDSYCQNQRAEIERLKISNDDLLEKLESSELQINAISNEYRVIVQNKERELQELQAQRNEYYEFGRGADGDCSGPAPSSSPPGMSHSLSMPSLHAKHAADDHDFDDVISSQHEINRLRSENRRLEAELSHWRHRSQTQQAPGEDAGRIDSLQTQVKELQQQYEDELDHHQRELAALQDVHGQKLATIKRKHKEELAHLHAEMAELRSVTPDITRDTDSPSPSNLKELRDLRDKVEHLEAINRKLGIDLELTHAADREKARRLDYLTEQINSLSKQHDKVLTEKSSLAQENGELLHQLDAVVAERRELSNKCSELSAKLSEKKPRSASSGSRTEPSSLLSSTPAKAGKRHSVPLLNTSDLDSLHDEPTLASNLSELSERNKGLDVLVKSLQDQVDVYEAEVKQFDLVRSDWQTEKEALEQVLLSLRDQLRDRDNQLCDRDNQLRDLDDQLRQTQHNQLINTASSAESKMDLAELHHQVELLTQEKSLVEDERNALAAEKANLLSLVAELREQLEISKTKTSGSDEKQKQSGKSKHIDANIPQLTASHALSSVQKTQEQPLSNLTDEIETLQQNIKLIHSEKDELDKRLAESLEEIQKLKATIHNIDEEKLGINEKVFDLVAAKDQLLSENLDLKSRVEEVSVEKDRQAARLLEMTQERDALIVSLEELDSQHEAALSQIISAREKLAQENEQLRLDLSSLEESHVAEDDSSAEELAKLRSERERVAIALNDLHMQNQELSEAKTKLKDEKKMLAEKLHELSKDCKALRQEMEKICTERDADGGRIKYLEAEISRLERNDNLNSAQEQLESQLKQNEELQQEIASLQQQLTESVPKSEFVKSESEWREESARHQDEIIDLEANIESLEQEKLQLEGERDDLLQKCEDQRREFELFSEEVSRSRQLDGEDLQTEHEKLLADVKDKNMQISELNSKLVNFQGTLTSTSEKLKSEVTRLEEIIKSRDAEISSLREQNEKFAISDADLIRKLSEQESEIATLKGDHEKHLEKIKSLEVLLENASGTDDVDSVPVIPSRFINDFEQEVKSLNLRFDEEHAKMASQKSEIVSLKDKVTQQVNVIESLEAELETLKSNHHSSNGVTLHSTEKSEKTISNRGRLKDQVNDIDNTVLQNGDIDGDIDVDIHSKAASAEIGKWKNLLSQKDSVIAQLNDNNSALLHLLEERSQAVYNDNTLLDIHKLESDVRKLRAEKDQMMSVLNEKSRECSSLKAEVHRLMNVISAEKSAINKLQSDNQELVKKLASPTKTDAQNHDMKQDAIKKLSQLVRDKDVEIEALSQKNRTLLQVLQESSDAGSQLSSLIQEKENLQRQIQAFQADREQIISVINIKHQESVAYHDEMQRLGVALNNETRVHEQLQMDYSSLKKQFEDKQQALVKAQNEMLNYKRKFTELDTRYRDLQRRRGSSGNMTPRSPSPPIHSQIIPESVEINAMQTGPSPNSSLANFAQEVDDLKTVIRNQEDAFAEKDRLIQSQEAALQEKDRAIWERDGTIGQKDKLLSELHIKLHRAEENVHTKDAEMSSYKKQVDNLSFQLKGIQTEFCDLRTERDQLYERNSVLQQEIGTMKDMTSRLTMSLNDREFEIGSMKERALTLTKLLEERGEGEKGEMDRMMRETDSLQAQAQTLKQERDQNILALQQQQTEHQQLRNEIQRLREKGDKQVKELERLRRHLLTIEENYTQDALNAEEREKELRNRLSNAEEKAFSSSSAVQAANQQAYKQVESLQVQLHVLAEQRDDALLQLSSAQETANQYATSLQNLQSVLEQFQMERETQLNSDVERYQNEVVAYQKENNKLLDEIRQLQTEVDETSDALAAAQRLSEQLDRKELLISALREEVQLREAELLRSEEERTRLSSSTEAKVDKLLMKNLIVGYFHAPPSSRDDALRLLGRMLDFTESDMTQVHSDGRRGWFGGLFKKPAPTSPNAQNTSLNKSFSELFVTFLERESSPKPSLRLPADRMIEESQRRHSHGHQGPLLSPGPRHESLKTTSQPSFNPFSAPMHVSMPLHVNTAGNTRYSNTSNSLVNPLTPSLPMFTSSNSSNLLIASTGTSMNSGSILRDVLQQQ